MRAALYIDCDSIEAKAVPVIYEDIIRTDKLVTKTEGYVQYE